MPAELGQSSDPRALVPGDPDALARDLRALAASMRAVEGTGDRLRRVDHPPSWKGRASEAYGAAFGGEPPKWACAVEDLDGGGTALADYADVLNWSQGRAQRAIELFARGEAASQAAAARYHALAAMPGGASLGPFVDPGDKHRQEARAILADARGKKDAAGGKAAAALGAGRAEQRFGPAPTPARGVSGGSTSKGMLPLEGLLEDFGIDVPTHTATASAGASAVSGTARGSFDAGPVSGSAQASGSAIGADAGAHASASKLGVGAGANAEAYLAKGGASGKMRFGDHAGVGASGTAFVGGKADAGVHVGATGAQGHAGAFVGGKASGKAHADVGGVKAGAHGSIQYGVGVHADGQFGMGDDGEFHIGFDVGGTLGVGASGGTDISIDPEEVVDTVEDVAGTVEDVGGTVVHGFAQGAEALGDFLGI
jgi:hypothetical protein